MIDVQFEFEVIVQGCEGYADDETVSVESIIESGNFQWCTPILKRWRTFELNEDGEEFNHSEWVTPTKEIKVRNRGLPKLRPDD